MTSFIVETYTPLDAAAPEHVIAQARRVATRLAATGEGVRHLHSYVVLGDEQCFHVFEAGSPDDLTRAALLPGVDIERVVEAVDLDGGPGLRALDGQNTGDSSVSARRGGP